MILRRFYITENNNGARVILSCYKLVLFIPAAPVPKSKAKRVLKTDIS